MFKGAGMVNFAAAVDPRLRNAGLYVGVKGVAASDVAQSEEGFKAVDARGVTAAEEGPSTLGVPATLLRTIDIISRAAALEDDTESGLVPVSSAASWLLLISARSTK